jgi:hypothetical protein
VRLRIAAFRTLLIGIATGVPSANSIRSLLQNKFLLDAHTVERTGG